MTLSTYRATLKGNCLEWTNEAPLRSEQDESIPVYVTVLTESPEDGSKRAQGEQMAAALARIAALDSRGGVSVMEDPVQWQREIRQDRDLPDQDA